jgi:acetoacetyl-CoA synthetase
MRTQVREGDLLWTPSAARVAGANLTTFTSWLAAERGLCFDDYHALWRWSVDDLEGFWQAVWDYCGIDASVPPERVLGRRAMPGAEWFPGARLNYAQHALRREQPGEDALLFLSETTPVAGLDWAEFAGQVRIIGTRLRGMGVRPGDRVASYLPNIPQTVIAMLATMSAPGSSGACQHSRSTRARSRRRTWGWPRARSTATARASSTRSASW